jgi:hypothetical protein
MTEPLGQFKRKHGKGLTASTRHSPRSTAIPGAPSHLLLDDGRATGWASCLEVFNQSVQYWGRLQQDGKIERFDLALLSPHGSDLGGFALLRGTAQQIDSVQHEEEWHRLVAAVRLRVDGLGLVDALVDEELAKQMGYYQDAVGDLG